MELKLQSLHIPMLDWTTSFLSDETIIKPRKKSVKQFLRHHKICAGPVWLALAIVHAQEKCPAFLRGIDENQEATPVALEDSTLPETQKCNWCAITQGC